MQLKSVITTHHHWDHAGGNGKLVSKATASGLSLKVYGGDDRIDALTNKVGQDDTFLLGSLTVRCLFTPCHTTGHICYYIDAPSGERAVFTGDTLFLGGCGRFFEGTADQMHEALVIKLSQLPDDTKVYCGHEYTLQNLAFGQHVEPNNTDVANKIEWSRKQRDQNLPTVRNAYIFFSCIRKMMKDQFDIFSNEKKNRYHRPSLKRNLSIRSCALEWHRFKHMLESLTKYLQWLQFVKRRTHSRPNLLSQISGPIKLFMFTFKIQNYLHYFLLISFTKNKIFIKYS